MADFNKILNTIDSNIDSEINLFNHELEAVLKKIADLVKNRAIENYSNPLEFDFAMQQVLADSGYYDLVDDFINKSYDKNYNEIISLFQSSGLLTTFSEADIADIKAIKKLDLEFFKSIGNQASLKLKADLYKYSLSNLSTDEMVENIAKSLEETDLVRYSSTYAETAIGNFNQAIIDLKSVDLKDTVRIYTGVLDKKTRTFCKCVLKQRKYYNNSEGMKLKSDPRRAYNCRHLIIPVSLSFATERGYTSGKFTC